MINIINVTKTFGTFKALDDVSATIKDASIFGLIGPNGSGKSTLLKALCGAYRTDSGIIEIDGENVYENPIVKSKLIYLSDEQYFIPGSTIPEMAEFYKSIYNSFNDEIYNTLCGVFKLDLKKKISTFSKGMQKQASVLLALSIRPRYLFCDETFDGLDPVMRQFVKKLLASDAAEYKTTTILASHNMRELEDICDHVGLLHKGGILFERELDDLKLGVHNFQCVFGENIIPARSEFSGLDILNYKISGSLIKITVRGDKEKTAEIIRAKKPVFFESLPLTLEEIFIEEMEGIGYDFSNVIQ